MGRSPVEAGPPPEQRTALMSAVTSVRADCSCRAVLKAVREQLWSVEGLIPHSELDSRQETSLALCQCF